MQDSYIYIMSNRKDGTLYIGVTSDLVKRVYEHKNEMKGKFTHKYNLGKLVYYEVHSHIEEAIKREKRLKSWLRQWKIELIEKDNHEWVDLYAHILGDPAIKPQDDVVLS